MVVATRNAACEPFATRASALRVLSPERIAVLLPRATSARALDNLRDNGELAVCICRPSDFRTFQLKGRCERIQPAGVEDVLVAEEQLRGFTDVVEGFGYTRAQARNLWLLDGWCVEMLVTAGYAQTPGPGAGAELGRDAG